MGTLVEGQAPAAQLQVLGLSAEEYARICALLGRAPNAVELGMFGAMWSEHCGYKNSRPLLRRFPTGGPRVLVGPGENAGAVDLGGGLALVLKIESHNHPSAIEPYQGAATGVGGILRDIFAMGARPIALLDSLRFGLPTPDLAERLRFLVHGVVAGVGGYGNPMGVPTVGGETVFDPCYAGNPLVNAMCVGLVEPDRMVTVHAGAPGNLVVLIGAATGRDGIHGATFASVELDERSEERRPAVQVGDPLTEKLLLEACLDLRDRGLIAGMQDLGAAGLTSSTVEMADKSGAGIEIDLARVPRRAPDMTPYELMLSESQERMLVACAPQQLPAIEAVLDRWELPHAVIGRITDDGLVRVCEGDAVVAAVPVRHFTDDCPVYTRVGHEDGAVRLARDRAPLLATPDGWGEELLALLAHPNIGSKAPIWQQYDHMVGTNTVVAPGADAAVLRLKGRSDGVALAVDGNGRLTYLDPYTGGALAVLEAARNLACVGARPLCVTDCLNFGNPEKPGVYYQLERAIAGMADACRALDIPVVSGNVSLYNESQDGAIYPTPIVGMAGQIDDLARLCTPGFKAAGDRVLLLGGDAVSLAGSAYAQAHGNDPCGRPAPLDIPLECRVQRCCLEAIEANLLRSAHDCSEGGLAVALAECALAGNLGAHLATPSEPAAASPLHAADFSNDRQTGASPDSSAWTAVAQVLFGEGPARIVVSGDPAALPALTALAARHEVPLRALGTVEGDALIWDGICAVPLEHLRRRYDHALDEVLGK